MMMMMIITTRFQPFIVKHLFAERIVVFHWISQMYFSPVSAYEHIPGPCPNTLKKEYSSISWGKRNNNVFIVLPPHTLL